VSSLGQLLRAIPAPAALRVDKEVCVPSVVPDTDTATETVVAPATSVRDEQMHSLVYQLFLQQKAARVRNVCFAPIESPEPVVSLCVGVAHLLAAEGKCDVGLIDACAGAIPLEQHLQTPTPKAGDSSLQVAPCLWLVSRDAWLKKSGLEPISNRVLERLCDSMSEFDFSVLCCGPVSATTLRIAQRCDGLVLILTANKTRRLVATQVKEQLARAGVPLLGTVLAERRLPVPTALYQRL